jgi:hypothetical protein
MAAGVVGDQDVHAIWRGDKAHKSALQNRSLMGETDERTAQMEECLMDVHRAA